MTYKTKTADEYEKVIAKASIENKKKIANIYDEVITDVLIEKGVLELDEIEEASNKSIPSVVLDEKAYQLGVLYG